MKTLTLISTILLLAGQFGGATTQYDEDHLQASLKLYLRSGSLVNLDQVQSELKEQQVQLKIQDAQGESLSLPEAKIRVARGSVCTMICVYPNGRVKTVQISPDASSEVRDAIKRTYEGFGASVTIER